MTSAPPCFSIDITVRNVTSVIAENVLRQTAEITLSEESIPAAEISLVLTDDAEIHRINREFLGHDYPTDVISFRLDSGVAGAGALREAPVISTDCSGASPKAAPAPATRSVDIEQPQSGSGAAVAPGLEGELIISLETAARAAAAEGWSLESEVVLYVVHGLLHLCGYDDLTDDARPLMRRRERDILTKLNRCPAGAIEPERSA